MFPHVIDVRHVGDYRLVLTFSDDTRAEIDFRDRVVGRGGIFAPLADIEYFRRVQIDPEARTLVWPNGLDLCPVVLYSQATGQPIVEMEPT
ncbi:MAG: DUF2442 domain-containing protein [Anaerolineae bacterium]